MSSSYRRVARSKRPTSSAGYAVRSTAGFAEEMLLSQGARIAQLALVDGGVSIVVAPRGRLLIALRLTVVGDRISAMDVIAEPARLRRGDVAILSN
jgi:hypothetical protein